MRGTAFWSFISTCRLKPWNRLRRHGALQWKIKGCAYVFCVGAGRRVIMSRCYSRHSSFLHFLPLAVAPFVLCIHFPTFPSPRAFATERLPWSRRRVERLCFYLRRRSILGHRHKGVISDMLYAVMGERKKEVTATFRSVPQNGDKNDVRPLS